MAERFKIPGGGSFTVTVDKEFEAGDVIKIEPRYSENKASQASLATLEALLKLLGALVKSEHFARDGVLKSVTVKTVRPRMFEWGWTEEKDTFRFPLHLSDRAGGAAFGIRCTRATLEINAKGWVLEIV